ncbi:MAG: DUF134 domain-containing protein [Bacteroidetes bacterium]|nr:DUF134 domain-containing protein [Bacteroidota bacterium]
MARPVKIRKILFPRADEIVNLRENAKPGKPVLMTEDEFESIILVDYEKMMHLQASELMGVSRPTLTRIYERARMKLAEALVESRQIKITGGKVETGQEWFECISCGSVFNLPGKKIPDSCPVCSAQAKKIKLIKNDGNRSDRRIF